MNSQQARLSIIMTCYNVGQTLERALDSIFMQEVNFDFEVIVIDDFSQDTTADIVKNYAVKHHNLWLLQNNKNQGHAISFYKGLSAAIGDYYCVLDGDDYYTINNKLQRQVDFLDNDITEEYVAVAHNYIIDLGNGQLNIPNVYYADEFNYIDILTEKARYCHTSTYMYRNIFKNHVPDFFQDRLFEGDTPRTALHLLFSNKKVKILNFVGSVYTYSLNGIWSKLSLKEQFESTINYLEHFKTIANSAFEQQAINLKIKRLKERIKTSTDSKRIFPSIDINTCLKRIEYYAKKYAFSCQDFISRGIYYSEYLDTLCLTLGYVYRLIHPEIAQSKCNSNNVCIITAQPSLCNEKLFCEIKEVIETHKNNQIFILSTSDETESTPSSIALLKNNDNLTFKPISAHCKDKLGYLYTELKEIAPQKTYYYISHTDAYAATLMQQSSSEIITPFSISSGYVLGISNPNINHIIAKRPFEYWILKKQFGPKVTYAPLWNALCTSICCNNFPEPAFVNAINNKIHDVCNYMNLFGTKGRITMMLPEEKILALEQKLTQMEKQSQTQKTALEEKLRQKEKLAEKQKLLLDEKLMQEQKLIIEKQNLEQKLVLSQINAIKASFSYKIGILIAFLPGKICKCMITTKSSLVHSEQINLVSELKRLEKSKVLKIGKIFTLPLRKCWVILEKVLD